MSAPLLYLHAIEPRSRANGPGTRFVVWVQGCTLGCAGCYNPATHPGGGEAWTIDALVDQLLATSGIDGVTVSGGEPFEQADGLLAFARAIRERTHLSLLIFSGFTRAEIEATPTGAAVLSHIDVLIDGRYVAGQRISTEARGSANQAVHLLTDRYTEADVSATPEAEIRIDAQGRIHLTGVGPLVLKD